LLDECLEIQSNYGGYEEISNIRREVIRRHLAVTNSMSDFPDRATAGARMTAVDGDLVHLDISNDLKRISGHDNNNKKQFHAEVRRK
jgi:hypothetical protein